MATPPKSKSTRGPAIVGGRHCFVISPIGATQSDVRRHADMVLNVAIRPALEEHYEVKRVDEYPNPGMISREIISRISESDLCVVDLSYLNPNVMYEVGVRHTLQKSTIVIASEGTELPFDTAGHNTIFYDVTDFNSLTSLRWRIEEQAATTREPNFVLSNPITQALGHKSLSVKGDSESQLLAELDRKFSSLSEEVRWLHNRVRSSSSISSTADLFIDPTTVSNVTLQNALRNLQTVHLASSGADAERRAFLKRSAELSLPKTDTN